MPASVWIFVSRLQHHESTGGQREPSRKQRPALGGRRRQQPRRRPGPGHAPSDGRAAEPQVPPVQTRTHAPPSAAHAPPAGGGDGAQRGCRVLILTSLTGGRKFVFLKTFIFFKNISARLDCTRFGLSRLDEWMKRRAPQISFSHFLQPIVN